MEEIELKQIWELLNKNQIANLKINQQNMENITDLRVQSLLKTMKPTKIALVIIGIIWIVFVDILIVKLFKVASPFFIFSAIVQVVLTKLAIGIYLYQLITIQQVDLSDTITETQEKLAGLKSSTLWVARILFLQLPVWSTFYLHKAMFVSDNLWLLAFQIIVTFALIFISIWLFININPKNKDKKWFKLMFEGKEWKPVIKSIELLEDLKKFRV